MIKGGSQLTSLHQHVHYLQCNTVGIYSKATELLLEDHQRLELVRSIKQNEEKIVLLESDERMPD